MKPKLLFAFSTMRFPAMLLASIAFAIVAPTLSAHETEAPPRSGEEIYQLYCGACHGMNFEGGKAGSLIKEVWQFGSQRYAMRDHVNFGIATVGMPPFGAVLSSEEVNNVLDYVVSKQGTKPGANPQARRDVPKEVKTERNTLTVEVLVKEGLNIPTGIEWVDARRALVTERPGGLRWLVDGKLDPKPIAGLPPTWYFQDSGMLDLALHPNYEDNGWIYIANSHPIGDSMDRKTPAMLQVIRGRVDGHQWIDQETIFSVPEDEYTASSIHFGTRLLFDTEGYLYFSTGDKGTPEISQNLFSAQGKIHRLRADGSFPKDNPFYNHPTIHKSIFTYGNRNPQGIDQHPETGEIWATEHGPMGGDELNVVRPGLNHGWPIATYGKNHDGTIISDKTEYPGVTPPIHYWVPSIATCPIAFVDSERFPEWKNNLLVGALKYQEIRRLVFEGDKVVKEETLFQGYGRIRELKFGPDGALYALTNNPDQVLRFTPGASPRAENPESLIKRGKLVFSDTFNRSEQDESKEQLGKQWVTNTAKRAPGSKQADLDHGKLVIAMAKGAGHSASIRHDIAIDDGVISFKLQLFDKHGLKFNFNDPAANKVTWAGHIARVVLKPGSVQIQDDMTGVFDLTVRAKRQNKDLGKKEKAELAAFLETKQSTFDAPVKLGQWHNATIVFTGPRVDVYVDGDSVGSFTSEGLDHKVKQNFALGVSGKVIVDDIQVWSLD